MPDDDEVGNASHGVPAPLLRGTFCAVGSEETGQDHDDIGDNSHEDVSTVHAGEKSKVEEEERGGDGPVNVTSEEDLAVDVVEGVVDVLVLFSDLDVVPADTVAGGHGEVGDGSGDGDDGGDDVVETLGLEEVSRCTRLELPEG